MEGATVRTRLIGWWHAARESLWALPGGLVLAGVILAIALVDLDRSLALDHRGGRIWSFGGGADGARGVLEAIAGSLITVTGTVFSITIVTLQLASTQFTPRVLRTFMRDRGVQAVLGVFIGTFTYCLLVLRAVRSQSSDGARFVPGVSVVVAIALALVSVGFLIFFIHHMARAIQVDSVLARVTSDGTRLTEIRFPDGIGDAQQLSLEEATPPGAAASVAAPASGYLHYISADALFGIRTDEPLTIRVDRIVGDFVFAGEALASVWPAASADDRADAIRRGFALGMERTLEQDVELPVRQLADIAVKALSPGVNDPTTAVACVDRLAELLLRLARRGAPAIAHGRPGSRVRLIVRAPSFARLVETAFAQIRHFGVSDAVVARHLMDTLGRLNELVPPGCRPPLAAHGERLLAASLQTADGAGWDEIAQAASWLPMETLTAVLATGADGGHAVS
jgi:uncharacterized membrane protein